MKKATNRPLVWIILSMIGFGIFSISYVLAWHGEPSYPLFWTGLGICFFSILLLIRITKDMSRVVVILFLFGTLIYSMQIYRSQDFFIDRDQMDHYQGYNAIAATGFIDQDRTVYPEFNSYPGFEIAVAATTEVTGLQSFASGTVETGLVHSWMLVLLGLFFFRVTSSVSMAGLSALLYGISPHYAFFDAMVSYETFGLFFITALLLLVFHRVRYNERPIVILSLIVTLALVITHHASAYMWVIYLIFLTGFVAYRVRRGDRSLSVRKILIFTIFAAVVSVGWLIYNAETTVGYVSQSILGRMADILYAGSFSGYGIKALAPTNAPWDPVYELIIRRLFYIPELMLLSAIGIYYMVKRGVLRQVLEPGALVFWGPVLFVASIPFCISTATGAELGYRMWAFVFIGLVLMVAIVYTELWGKRSLLVNSAVVGTLLILLVGGISLGRPNMVRFPLFQRTDTISYYTLDTFKAADWMDLYAGERLSVAGTLTDWDVFGGYGAQIVNTKLSAMLFRSPTMNPVKSLLSDFSYAISDRREITTYYPGDLFSYEFEHLDGMLPSTCLTKFAGYPGLQDVYDNGNITLYKT